MEMLQRGQGRGVDQSLLGIAAKGTLRAGERAITALPICMWVGLTVIFAALVLLFTPARNQPASLSEFALTAEPKDAGYVHIRAMARLDENGNIGAVSEAGTLQPVEMWRTVSPSLLWAVQASDWAVLGDGKRRFAICGMEQGPLRSRYDGFSICNPTVGFVGYMLWGNQLLDIEDIRIRQWGLNADYVRSIGPDGLEKMTITISRPKDRAPYPVTPVSDWFGLEKSKRYVFDIQTGRMESACIFIPKPEGDVVLLETQSIEYTSNCDGEAAIEKLMETAQL